MRDLIRLLWYVISRLESWTQPGSRGRPRPSNILIGRLRKGDSGGQKQKLQNAQRRVPRRKKEKTFTWHGIFRTGCWRLGQSKCTAARRRSLPLCVFSFLHSSNTRPSRGSCCIFFYYTKCSILQTGIKIILQGVNNSFVPVARRLVWVTQHRRSRWHSINWRARGGGWRPPPSCFAALYRLKNTSRSP